MRKVFFSLVVLLMSISMSAQTPEKKEKILGEVSVPLSSLRLANDLVPYGYSQQTALPLIQALQIMSETPTQNLRGDKEKGSDTIVKDSKEEKVSFDYAKILADAKDFADGNEHLLALIYDKTCKK